jgi:prefoldin subunit 5
MENIIYTPKEIQKNIEVLTNRMESLKLERTELTQNINSIKKQIQYWLDLDKSQLKLL